MGLLVALAASGAGFDVSFVRRAVEEELGKALGRRAVAIEGDLLLASSFSNPGVGAESVRVLSPGQAGRDWAGPDSVELGVRLSSPWQGGVELNRILVAGLDIYRD